MNYLFLFWGLCYSFSLHSQNKLNPIPLHFANNILVNSPNCILGNFDNDGLLDTAIYVKVDSNNGILFKFGNQSLLKLIPGNEDFVYHIDGDTLPQYKEKINYLSFNNWKIYTQKIIFDQFNKKEENKIIPDLAKIIANRFKALNIKIFNDVLLIDFGDIYYLLAYIDNDFYFIDLGV